MLVAHLASYLLAAVMAAGIVLAAARWRRHPKLSLLVVIALGLPLLLDLGPFHLQRLPAVYSRLSVLGPAERRLVFTMEQTLGQLSRAASYVLLLVAAFGRRTKPKPRQSVPSRPPGLLRKWIRGGGVSPNP